MTAEGSIGEAAVALIRMRARSGITTGHDQHPVERAYLRRCTHFHWRTGTVVMFTRDTGHHSSGWMKNPDFEHCRHLSLSFRQPYPERDPASLANVHTLGTLMRNADRIMELAPFDPGLAAEWVKLIHGEDRRLAWEEGPFSREGQQLSVRHYRVFTDPSGAAIKPRGEVYNTELTELGWKSWSEVQGESAPRNWGDAE